MHGRRSWLGGLLTTVRLLAVGLLLLFLALILLLAIFTILAAILLFILGLFKFEIEVRTESLRAERDLTKGLLEVLNVQIERDES